MRALFFVLVLILWASVHLYLGRRLIDTAKLKKTLRSSLWAVVGAGSLVAPLSFAMGRWAGRPEWTSVVSWAAYLYMALFSIVLSLTLLRDLGLIIGRPIWRRLPRPEPPEDDKDAPPMPSRRAFLMGLSNAGIASTAGVMVGVGVKEARRVPAVVNVEVPIEGLHPDLDGFTIAQVTDLHVGPTIKRPFVSSVVEVVNGLDADIVAVTGDLIDGVVDALRGDLEPLKDLKSKQGVFYVTGNHEYYWDAPSWIAETRRMGMKTLVNSHEVIQKGAGKAVIAGVTDLKAETIIPEHRTDPAKAIEGAPKDAVKILLAHQPRSVFEAAKHGYDLQLSGHTHGGQFVPWNFVVWLAQPFTHGLHLFEGMWIYVSRGTGYWGPPVRLAAPSEITLLTLKAKARG